MLSELIAERFGPPRVLELPGHRIWALTDGTFRPRPWYFAPDADQSEHAHRFTRGGDLEVLPIGCFVIEGAGDRTILVDAGLGPGTLRCTSGAPGDERDYGLLEGGALPEQLRLAGIEPEAVTDVVVTHFHIDHIGWLLDAPFHPSVNVWGSRRDHEYFERWRRRTGSFAVMDEQERRLCARALDAVADHADAGRLHYRDGGDIAPGVRMMPSPGHTPGHASVEVGTGSAQAILVGDALTIPTQIAIPSWHSIGDVDVTQAEASRAAILDRLRGGAVMNGCHFSGLDWGILDPDGNWSPAVRPAW